DLFSQRLDKVVVDAVVDERTGERAGACSRGGADDQPGERVHKQYPDEGSPKRAPCTARQRAGADQVHRLLEMKLSFFVASDDAGVFEVDKMGLLHRTQVIQHLVGRMPTLEGDTNKLAHSLLPSAIPFVFAARL